MNTTTCSRLLPSLLASLLLAAPAASFAKDKDKHKHHHDDCRSKSRTVHVGGPYYSRSPFSPYYSGYGRPSSYGSSYYSSRSCAPRTSIGFSLFGSPSYSSYRSSRTSYPSNYSSYSSRSSYSDDLAEDVQRALRRSGYYYGDIDGDIGPESRAAIYAYQRDRGLPATGRIDSSLLRSLRIG